MEVIYGLIPSMIIIGLILVGILFWAVKSGQFDDFEGDAHRILLDEDLTPEKKPEPEEKTAVDPETKADKTTDNS